MNEKINPNRLFLASCLALVVTSMTFAFRAKLNVVFGADGYGLSEKDMGLAFGPAFWGFTLAMVIGGPLVDALGMRRILFGAFIMHAIGIVVTIFATEFYTLFFGTLAIGLGNGLVEAACNPLVATLYPDEKTKMLNRFHVWFPGGIVIGSLVAYFLVDLNILNVGENISWQIMLGTLFIPLVIYGFLFLGQEMPKTERVSMGVSTGDMWSSLANPLFLFMAVCMLLTASTELGTNQNIEALLKEAEAKPLLALALTSGVMALGRAFAGPIAHRLSTSGMLLFSAVFSTLGLIGLSMATGNMVYAAAIVFGVGITFFWPTMLSFVSEEIPKSGALGLSVMGGLGMFATSLVLPIMGVFLDENMSGAQVLQRMAFLPAVLIVAFLLLHFVIMPGRKKNTPEKELV
ncbi:MAG: MFS transporter [Bacteroidia bacterium]|nr:MFS transporter [Bacteroidia bacterium]